jgi:hypothetical protein
MKHVVLRLVDYLQGAFACIALLKQVPDTLVVIRKGSPVCIGIGDDENFVASDVLAFSAYTKKAFFLPEKTFAFVTRHTIEVYDFSGNAVEVVPEAIIDAKENAERNQIENTEFFVGDMKKVFSEEFINNHGTPDVIITDPPRDGMHKDVIAQVIGILPQRIVYVSCNSATQARDLALLDEHYQVTKVQPVDMFPQTHHVENVVCLERK